MALKEKYRNKVEFIIVNVDDPQGQALAAEYEIDAIPAFRFINGKGNVAASFTGTAGEKVIEEYMKKMFE